jgi:hypothetical protein
MTDTMKITKQIILFSIAAILSNSCSDATKNDGRTRKLDIAKPEEVLGMKGTTKDGEFKITVAQNDLNVVVDGFKIIQFHTV